MWKILFKKEKIQILKISIFLYDNNDKNGESFDINWFFHTDNNLLYYDNRSLAERFPETDRRWKNKKLGGVEGIKSILRGNIDIKIYDHKLSPKFISCDGFGNIQQIEGITTNNSDHYYYYHITISSIN